MLVWSASQNMLSLTQLTFFNKTQDLLVQEEAAQHTTECDPWQFSSSYEKLSHLTGTSPSPSNLHPISGTLTSLKRSSSPLQPARQYVPSERQEEWKIFASSHNRRYTTTPADGVVGCIWKQWRHNQNCRCGRGQPHKAACGFWSHSITV